MTRRRSVWCAVIGLLFALCAAPSLTAAQDQKRVVIMPFKGPSGAAARKQVVQGLKERSELKIVPASQLRAGGDLHEAAAEAQVSAVIEGRVAKHGKQLEINVSVRDTESGEVVHEEKWTRKKPQLKNLHGNVWKKLGPHIMRTRAPEKKEEEPAPVAEREPEPEPEEKPKPKPKRKPEPEPAPVLAAEPEEEESKATEPGSSLHPALIASLGPRLMWRSLSYEGATTLSSYSSYGKDGGTPAFNMALSLAWFPGAHVSSKWYSNLGLEGDIDYSIGLKSKQGNSELKTAAYEFGAGALVRIPLDTFEPRIRAGYVKHTFDVDVPATTPLPAVSYGAVRIGAGCVINLVEAFAFDVNFGALIVLDTGEIGTKTYAEKLSAFAWEASGGAIVRFKQRYGIRGSADYRRYNLDFGGSTNANWALPKKGSDEYLRATLSFVYMLPGVN